MLKKRLFPILCLFYVTTSIEAQNKYYVTEFGDGIKDGSSWINASNNLAQTVSRSSLNDTIWVAKGTYKGGFKMKEGVQVFGGFSGVETTLKERKLPASGENITVLDGNNTHKVLIQETVFQTPTAWDGFVIQNGSGSNGAGVYLWSNGIVRRCIIKNNHAGMPSIGDYLPKEGGVVFHTDASKKKAWLIATQDYGRTYQLTAGFKIVDKLADALQDMNGIQNSEALSQARAVQILKEYHAEVPAHNFDDWYLPSAGEWGLFIAKNDSTIGKTSTYNLVEESLIKNGKTPLDGKKYWSSTTAKQHRLPSAWYVNFESDDFSKVNIWQYNKIRAVRAFSVSANEGKGGAVYALVGSRIEGCLIMNNSAGLGSAICARGDIIIANNTIINNKLNSTNSSVIDANSGVKVYNTIIVSNDDHMGTPTNYDKDILYKYSAIETTEILFGDNNILVENSDAIKFKDKDLDDYRLQKGSLCASKGDNNLTSKALDSDIAGYSHNTSAISIGAFQENTLSSIEENKANGIDIYPKVMQSGTFFTVTLEQNDTSLEDATIVLYDIAGTKVKSQKASQWNSIQAPNIAGVYILEIQLKNAESSKSKIVVTN